MRKITIIAALAASTAAFTGTASAQQRGGIIVVDTENIMETCTACRAATAQLQQQATSAQQLQTSLMQPLETEAKSIEAAIKALGAKANSDAAIQKRAQAFQQREASARQQLQQRQQTLRSTAQNVQQQIGRRLITVVEAVRARRGAAIAINKNSTLANDGTVDVTAEVLAALNQQLPAVSVTPLPQQAQQQQQPGR